MIAHYQQIWVDSTPSPKEAGEGLTAQGGGEGLTTQGGREGLTTQGGRGWAPNPKRQGWAHSPRRQGGVDNPRRQGGLQTPQVFNTCNLQAKTGSAAANQIFGMTLHGYVTLSLHRAGICCPWLFLLTKPESLVLALRLGFL